MAFAARIGLLGVLLMTSLGACANVDETRETADTVDHAVALMQALDRRGAAARVSQGADDLGTAGVAYEAMVVARQGRLNADGTAGPATREWTYSLQVDAEGDLLATFADGETEATYVVPGDEPLPAPVYRVTADGYVCASDDPAAAGLSASLAGLIAAQDMQAAAVQTLAVITRPTEATIAGREATQYTFVSRVSDALRILDEYGGNDDLQQAVAAAESVTFAGGVAFDDATGALLRLNSTTNRRDEGLWARLAFELTAWGGVAEVSRPAAGQIAVPCG
jgi:hypothetical protein